MSVTVILMLLLLSIEAYLFSLLRIGEGLTRKSRSVVHMVQAKFGNLFASFPRDYNMNVYIHQNLI